MLPERVAALPGIENRRPVEAPLIVAMLDAHGIVVTARQVWWWGQRGQVQHYGRPRTPRLYDWYEVLAYVEGRADLRAVLDATQPAVQL